MLSRLFIQNYAIIERQEIAFDKGLNIITGETGAGKSILLGALSLVMGQRADSGVLHEKDQKAIVEATFTRYPQSLNAVLEENDLDVLDEIFLRREILPSGKSRAFVNDTPVRLNVMQQVSSVLVDMHKQFESLEIQDASMQYEILDAFAGITTEVNAYRRTYQEYIALNKRIASLTEQRTQALQQRDYLQFQVDELQAIDLAPGQFEEWETEFHMLSNASEIKSTLSEGAEALDGSESGIVEILRALTSALRQHAHAGALKELCDRLEALTVEAGDLGRELYSQADAVEPDPQQQAALEKNIDTVRRLMMKHGVNTDEELIGIRTNVEEQLAGWEALSDDLERTEREREALYDDLVSRATEIQTARTGEAPALSEVVGGLLHDLEMKNAVLTVELAPLDEPTANGMDQVEFLFSANLGTPQMPVRKVASGGELSRLSLCIKSVVSQKMQLPTLIFDEIDTGVSGQVALKMGALLQTLSDRHQIIMITHSPQIASRAREHLVVRKFDRRKRSIAEVLHLDESDRILEIAKMLSGDPPTEAAVLNAKELINV